MPAWPSAMDINPGPAGTSLRATNSFSDYLPQLHLHHQPQGSHVNHEADNTPHRFEAFILADGESKVTYEDDTRTPNTQIFTFNKEDHTLGNLLRARLLANPHVPFAAYKIAHPMFPSFTLRVQTDGTLTPKQAVMGACTEVINDLSILSREFTKEWELRKMVGAAGQDGTNGH